MKKEESNFSTLAYLCLKLYNKCFLIYDLVFLNGRHSYFVSGGFWKNTNL